MDKNIIISIKTILIAFLGVLGIYVIYKLGPIIAIIFFCTILVIALEHAVKKFMAMTIMNRPMPRSIAVFITYAILVTLVVTVFTIGLPPVISQSQKLSTGVSQISSTFNLNGKLDLSIESILPQISSFSGGVINAAGSLLSNITTLFSVLILSIYMSLDWENIKKRFVSLFTGKVKKEVQESIDEVEVSIGHWVKGQLALMLIIGLLSYMALVALRVDYPLAIGIIAGILEVVPIIGPIISTVIATIIAFSDSPIKGVAILLIFIVIQQLENNLLVPKVMQKVSGFSPLIILIALLIGSNLFGVVGAILAVPMTMVGVIILKRVLRYSA